MTRVHAASSSGARVLVITGAASGLGRAVAETMAARGWWVFATMREPARPEGAALRALASEKGWRLETPALDVTSDTSVGACAAHVFETTGGRVDVLLNNAGFMLAGPLEETSPDELAAQLDTNVVGVHRVTRAFLPAMRARGEGCLAFVGSVSGRVALPFIAGYHASKWALAAWVEGLRYEVAPFGLRVVLFEPGPFATELHAKERRARETDTRSPYAVFFARFMQRNHDVPRAPAADFVACFERALAAPSPALRWPVGPFSFSGTTLKRLVPDRLYEIVLTWILGLRPGRRPAPPA
jgi:NAD(P)-dependent dehydrogenase (short-subunit alcohol dehydrogenase family)